MHCSSCHWITVSSIGYLAGEVTVYNSLYTDIDEATKHKIEKVDSQQGITTGLAGETGHQCSYILRCVELKTA